MLVHGRLGEKMFTFNPADCVGEGIIHMIFCFNERCFCFKSCSYNHVNNAPALNWDRLI